MTIVVYWMKYEQLYFLLAILYYVFCDFLVISLCNVGYLNLSLLIIWKSNYRSVQILCTFVCWHVNLPLFFTDVGHPPWGGRWKEGGSFEQIFILPALLMTCIVTIDCKSLTLIHHSFNVPANRGCFLESLPKCFWLTVSRMTVHWLSQACPTVNFFKFCCYFIQL